MRSRHARLRNSIKRRKQPLVERRALPTPERLRRAGADVERGDSGQITMRDSPLERAFARNALTAEQYSAGQKYRHHWYHAGLAGRVGSPDLNRVLAVDLGAYAGLLGKHPAIIGGALLRDFRRQRDDASVIVIKAA